jgi:hypothetical protein
MFLQPALQLFAMSADEIEVIVAYLAPLGFGLVFEFFPITSMRSQFIDLLLGNRQCTSTTRTVDGSSRLRLVLEGI